MAYDLDLYAARVLPRLDDGPKTVEQLGVTWGVIRTMQRHGLVRPKMRVCFSRDGKRVGAIQMWQRCEVEAPAPQREDCALMDFVAMGIA
jgi:hypothetical protein